MSPKIPLAVGLFDYVTVDKFPPNIARGTTDPEIDSLTWIELGNNMAPPISCKFGYQMAPLALDANLATRWPHLH